MASVIPTVRGPGGFERNLAPGDSVLIARSITDISTVGAGTWTAAAMASGYIRRTGPTAAYADTLDTGQNILNYLRGNAPNAPSLVGLSLEFTVANTVAFLNTVTASRGIILGTAGGVLNIPVSASKDFLLTIQNDSPEITVQGVATGNTTFTFTLPTGQSALPLGSAPGSVNITPGMLVTAGGGSGSVTAGSTVTSIKLGQGGIVGLVCSSNIGAGITALILSPRLELNNVGLD
jgi:hypothetical protein